MSHKDKSAKTPAPASAKAQIDIKAALSEQLESLATSAEEAIEGQVDSAVQSAKAVKEGIEAQIEGINDKIKTITETYEKFSAVLKPEDKPAKSPGPKAAKTQFDLRAALSEQLDAAAKSAKEAVEAQIESITDTIKGIEEGVAAFFSANEAESKPVKIPSVDLVKAQIDIKAALSEQLESLATSATEAVEGQVDSAVQSAKAVKEGIEAQIKSIDEKIKSLNEAVDKGKEAIHLIS